MLTLRAKPSQITTYTCVINSAQVALHCIALHCSMQTRRCCRESPASPASSNRVIACVNLKPLITPMFPVNLINSVILRTQLTQNNTNHLLGFRGMRTWPCVDATQNVILVGFWLSEARCRCRSAFPETRWQPCLSKISPTFFLVSAVSASSQTLSSQSYFHSIFWVRVAQYDVSTLVQGLWWSWNCEVCYG